MRDTTITTSPLSDSQACDSSRPRCAAVRAARRAGLGRTSFADFFEQRPVRNRFALKLVLKRRPGCVVEAFRHPGLGEFPSGHVAHHNVIESAHQRQRKLVLEIGSRNGNLGVKHNLFQRCALALYLPGLKVEAFRDF